MLPGLIPFDTLPRGRSELASSYPLAEVLASGWKEAITLRSDDIPALELTLTAGCSLSDRASCLGMKHDHSMSNQL